jgi:hypothetical protein
MKRSRDPTQLPQIKAAKNKHIHTRHDDDADADADEIQ